MEIFCVTHLYNMYIFCVDTLLGSLNDTHGNLLHRHSTHLCFWCVRRESGNVGVRFQERSPNRIGVELMTGVLEVNRIFSPLND